MQKIKTLSGFIRATPEVAFRFLADGANWPRWATNNVLEVRPAPNGGWDMRTPRGWGRLAIRPDEAHGILDHDFGDSEGTWSVPARVVPAPGGSVFMLTLAQPRDMPDELYPRALELVEDELRTLARVLEGAEARS